MAMETMALSNARGKMEQGEFQEAQTEAAEALVVARRGNDNTARLEALGIVAHAALYLGDTFAANLAVTDELAMLRRGSDRKAEVQCLHLVAEVHLARGDGSGAFEACQSATKLLDGAPDKAATAKTLTLLAMTQLALGRGKGSEALSPAQDALKIFQELKDDEGAKKARRALNMIYAGRNQLNKAPDRPEALQALKDLAAAADTRNGIAWSTAMGTLEETGAFEQKDIDEVVNAALEKDRYNASVFLEEQGVIVKQSGNNAGGKPTILLSEYPKTLHYIMFRVGGLGYGPRFRCGRPYRKAVQGGETQDNEALCCLQAAEEADDWERDLQFHPGILDSMLQACGVQNPNW